MRIFFSCVLFFSFFFYSIQAFCSDSPRYHEELEGHLTLVEWVSPVDEEGHLDWSLEKVTWVWGCVGSLLFGALASGLEFGLDFVALGNFFGTSFPLVFYFSNCLLSLAFSLAFIEVSHVFMRKCWRSDFDKEAWLHMKLRDRLHLTVVFFSFVILALPILFTQVYQACPPPVLVNMSLDEGNACGNAFINLMIAIAGGSAVASPTALIPASKSKWRVWLIRMFLRRKVNPESLLP